MANTGNVFPTSGTGWDRSAGGAWSNPGNIVSDNATNASLSGGADQDGLIASAFDFSGITDGSTINGITARFEMRDALGSTNRILNAQLRDASGTLFGSAKTVTITGGSTMTVYSLGGTSDLWGATITAAIVKDSDFGVQFYISNGSTIGEVDYVTLAVEWTAPSGIVPVLMRQYRQRRVA